MQRKTTIEHWNTAWAQRPRPRLPTGLRVGTKNAPEASRRRIRPGMTVLENGCASGEMLSWSTKGLDANVSGVDYSPQGVEIARSMLGEMGINGDIQQEDVSETSFASDNFVVAYCNGVVEHFKDLYELVAIHLLLLRPSDTVIILISNYDGIYSRLQHHFNPESLTIHNLAIISKEALRDLAPRSGGDHVTVYCTGLPSPWIVSWQRRWGTTGWLFSWALNVVPLLLPICVPSFCQLLIPEFRHAEVGIASRTPTNTAYHGGRRCN